jgi:glyoxylase-like metal-dependent hydrolase (beta-lactamase superfamily II)
MSTSSTKPEVFAFALPTPFKIGKVNAHLVKGDQVILVDCGVNTDDCYDTLKAGLAETGLGIGDIEVLLLTHSHIDHIGLAGRILNDSQAKAYAHPEVVERTALPDENEDEADRFILAITRELGVPEDMVEACASVRKGYRPLSPGVSIEHAVHNEETVVGMKVYHVPGHSATDTLFVNHDHSFAFTGDHLLKGITPSPLLRRPKPGEERVKSLVEYRRSLLRTRELDLGIGYAGHGDPITDHRKLVDNLLARQDRRNDRMLSLLDRAARTPFDLCMTLFPELALDNIYLGLSSVVGHLELLEDEGRAASELCEGVVYYSRLVD